MKRTIKERAEIVRQMRRDGKTVSEIADYLEMSKGGVNGIIRRNEIPLKEVKLQSECKWCGNLFTQNKTKNGNQKYCCRECERKANREHVNNPDESVAKAMAERLGDDWEYAGGYSGSDGFMLIRHKPCGAIMRKSCVSVRKGRNVICEHCREIEREEEEKEKEKQKRIREEVKEFNKPVKRVECISAQVCRVCGSLFFDQKRKYCSAECSERNMKHRQNMRKQRRSQQAKTPESYQITLESVYEKDGGICWICGGRCDLTADPNANNYPSIDHVFPISLGGKDEWSNVRLAHRFCNSLKGAKIIEPLEPVSISPYQIF